MRRRMATWLVAGALTVTLAGDVVAVVHVRGEQQREQREQAAQRADDAYREAVMAVARRLAPARAPVLEADELGLADSDAAPEVLYDVLVHGAVAADVREAEAALAAVAPPPPRRATHDELLAALARMREALDRMADPAKDEVGPDLVAFRQAGAAFDVAVRRDLEREVERVTTDALGPDTLTKAGLVYRWSLACSRALRDVEAVPVPDVEDTSAVAADLDRRADILRRTLDALLAAQVPDADGAALERDVRAPLRAVASAPEALRSFATALRNRDVNLLESALLNLDQLDVSFEGASRGMQAYGSSSCSVYLDGGLAGSEQAQPPDDTTAT